MAKPSFGYWKIRGFGHPIRFLLAYLGVDFDEKIYLETNEAEWFDNKFKMGFEFPNLPYWIDENDNIKVTETLAILKYLCRKYNKNLIPDEKLVWKSEMLEGVVNDTWELLASICYNPSETAETNYKDRSPIKLGLINGFIGDGKSFCMGNEPTYIDFHTYEMCYHYTMFNCDTLTPYPNILRFMKNFEGLDAIAEYMKSPGFISEPAFSKNQTKYHI